MRPLPASSSATHRRLGVAHHEFAGPEQLRWPDERLRTWAAARAATEFSYAPYSHFHVGAALLLADGKAFSRATNQENAALPLRRSAPSARRCLGWWAAAPIPPRLVGMAVAGRPATGEFGPAPPCRGRCRQVMPRRGAAPGRAHLAPAAQRARRAVLRFERLADSICRPCTSPPMTCPRGSASGQREDADERPQKNAMRASFAEASLTERHPNGMVEMLRPAQHDVLCGRFPNFPF
ncbi:MAG: hypothetical protein WKG07_19440 [Hymenobacter sp.]